jgi:hypothetical protein
LGDALTHVGAHNAEAGHFIRRDVHDCHREVCAFRIVEIDQIVIVLLVDVISRQHQHAVAARIGDEIAILVKRICRASIPILILPALVRLPDLHAIRL